LWVAADIVFALPYGTFRATDQTRAKLGTSLTVPPAGGPAHINTNDYSLQFDVIGQIETGRLS
jgi:hypothetical protein